MAELVYRAIVAGEEPLFASLPDPGLVGFAAVGRSFLEMVADGEYRPEWCWVALRGDTVVARAAWWGGPDDVEPKALDWFDFVDAEAAIKLLYAAPFRTEYSLRVPPDWRESVEVRAAVESRLAAAAAGGLRFLVERLTYRWSPECGVPQRPGRLGFRPEPDDLRVFEVLLRIQRDSLDAHSRRAQREHGIYSAAAHELDILRWMPGPREWWRLAYDSSGDVVGLVVPGRNFNSPIVEFVGVVPEHRGHGYAYELLVEATAMLAERGVERIVASTDLGNHPMKSAFAKAGYPVRAHRIDLI